MVEHARQNSLQWFEPTNKGTAWLLSLNIGATSELRVIYESVIILKLKCIVSFKV